MLDGAFVGEGNLEEKTSKEIQGYVEQTYSIECKGRNEKGQEVLSSPVEVNVKILKTAHSNDLSSLVECPYNTGSHGQRCKASHPYVDKVGDGVPCPYSFDIPYAFEKRIKK